MLSPGTMVYQAGQTVFHQSGSHLEAQEHRHEVRDKEGIEGKYVNGRSGLKNEVPEWKHVNQNNDSEWTEVHASSNLEEIEEIEDPEEESDQFKVPGRDKRLMSSVGKDGSS